MSNEKKLLLIDGSSMLVRAYFASAGRGYSRFAKNGVPTNAVMGFLNMTFAALAIYNPTHLFVAWDVSRDTFRRTLFPDYKGTRGELPDEMLHQFDTMQSVLQTFGVKQYQHSEYEADDILGSLATMAQTDGYLVTVLTGDRDALQLVDEHITVAIMKKGVKEILTYTPATLLTEYGLQPSQIIDLKGLMGDTSDNIPGVPGIGPKTATQLLQEYGTLEDILGAAAEIRGKTGSRLVEHREIAILSKKLATIVRDMPLPFTSHDCELRIQTEAALRKLEELDLTHLHTHIHKLQKSG